MTVAIIDNGLCNLGSIKRALEVCGGKNVIVTQNPKEANIATHIVLPGVGAFPDAMKNLADWVEVLHENVLDKGIPFLGICLGMQLMASEGTEFGITKGLNLIPGNVKKIDFSVDLRVPHVGWNEVEIKKDSVLFKNISNFTDFYFVHSYYFDVESENDILGTTPYGKSFPAVVGHDNIFGVQFHPEKSSQAGFQLLKNFLAL